MKGKKKKKMLHRRLYMLTTSGPNAVEEKEEKVTHTHSAISGTDIALA